MKKLFGMLMILLLSLSSSVSAMQVESVVSLAGGSYAGTFTPLTDDIRFNGLGANVPGEKTAEAGGNLDLGVELEVPFLGRHTISVVGTKAQTLGSTWDFNNFKVVKNVMYDLTDQVEIGVQIEYASGRLEQGARQVNIFSGIRPTLATTINLL